MHLLFVCEFVAALTSMTESFPLQSRIYHYITAYLHRIFCLFVLFILLVLPSVPRYCPCFSSHISHEQKGSVVYTAAKCQPMRENTCFQQITK